MDREEIRAHLVSYGLADKADSILALGVDCFGFSTDPEEDDNIAVGSSKLGGCPDMPVGVDWPCRGSRPLSFLGQIRIGDLMSCSGEELPVCEPDCLLSFSYDAEEQPWGFDPKDRDGWRVFGWSEELEQLERRELPCDEDDEEEFGFEACSVSFYRKFSLPSVGIVEETLGLDTDEVDRYAAFVEEVYDTQEGTGEHQVLGLPMEIQGEMRGDCQLAFHGVFVGDSSRYTHPDYEKLTEQDNTWVLLLQLDTDDGAGMMWGDVGRLFFWLRQEDLSKGVFENCWLVLQCA